MGDSINQITNKLFAILDPKANAEKLAKQFVNLLHSETFKVMLESLTHEQKKVFLEKNCELSDQETISQIREVIDIEEYKKQFKAIASKRCYELIQEFAPSITKSQKEEISKLLEAFD